MTANGTAIRALRQVQSLSLRALADLAMTSASQLSRIERGKSGAGDELLTRIAEALNVPEDDITRGEAVSTKELVAPQDADSDVVPDEASLDVIPEQTDSADAPKPRAKKTPREVPYPGTPAGELFHYTPEEAARFLPWSALQLKRRAYARQVPFNDGAARVSFTGRDIREISDMTAVRPLTETEPVQRRSA